MFQKLNFVHQKFSEQSNKSLLRAALLEEKHSPAYVLFTIAVLSLACVGLIAWASFAEMDERIVLSGIVQPSKEGLPVTSSTDATVSQLLVQNGERVKENQPLMILRPTKIALSSQELKERALSLQLDLIRLRHFMSDTALSVNDFHQQLSPTLELPADAEQKIHSAWLLLQEQQENRKNQKEALQQHLSQLQKTLEAQRLEINSKKKRLEMLGKSKEIYETLNQSNAVSNRSLTQAVERYRETENELSDLVLNEQATQAEWNETHQQLTESDSRLKDQTKRDMDQAHEQWTELQKMILTSQESATDQAILATEAGLIQGLTVTAGHSVHAGSPLLQIIPDHELRIEAQVPAQILSHLQVGNVAEIKFSDRNSETSKSHSLHGSLKEISTSAFLNQKGIPCHQAIIALEMPLKGSSISTNERVEGMNESSPEFDIAAGMAVRAEIITGHTTFLSYLLSPFK